MATAGQMILAGDVSRVLWWYEHAGHNTAAWNYAEEKLRQLHPDSATNSINAVLRIAHETVQVGANYARGGASYAPANRQIPDARPLELARPAGAPPPPPDPQGTYVHEGIITIRDLDRGGRVVQQFNVTIIDTKALTKEELLAALEGEIPELQRKYERMPFDRDSDETRTSVDARIMGVYRSL